MSSHHTQRFFNLHHSQVESGRQRKAQRQVDRDRVYQEKRQDGLFRYWCGTGFGILGFVYIMLAIPAWLRVIL